MRSFSQNIIVKEGDIGLACSMHQSYKEFIQTLSENMKGRDCLVDLGVERRILMISWEGVDYVHLAQNTD